MKYKHLIFLILIFFLTIKITKAEDVLLFKPLTANILEPRIGSLFEIQDKKLRLDIGTSIDLITIFKKDYEEVRLGTDFFTFTRLRSEGNFKFPVETSDYFFGINSTTKGKIENINYSARLRLAHISSHIVDGLAQDTILKRLPFVYSREFADLTGAINFDFSRVYLGLTYVFSKQPKLTNSIIPQAGIDARYPVNDILDIVGGYDFKLEGYDNKYFGTHAVQIGVLFKTTQNLGIMINGYLYNGKSIHGMFFMENDSYAGVGFQVIFY